LGKRTRYEEEKAKTLKEKSKRKVGKTSSRTFEKREKQGEKEMMTQATGKTPDK
jgi:hypothetical protein